MEEEKNLYQNLGQNPGQDESWIFMDQTWTEGELIRYIREERGSRSNQLANGIWSVATLSRIESGSRDPDLITMEVFLSRLGYFPQKFEMVGKADEFELYDMRSQMRGYAQSREVEPLTSMLVEYKKNLLAGKNEEASRLEDILHWQFIKEMDGCLALCAARNQEATACLEEAISYTLPQWRGHWEYDCIVSSYELQVLHMLSTAYERQGDTKRAYDTRYSIWRYLENKSYRQDQMPRLYTELICQMVPIILERGIPEEGIKLCDKALKALADTNRLLLWCYLLYWKGRCLEALEERGQVQRHEVVRIYQRAYYSYRLMKKEEEAQRLKQHLKERYAWESI